MEDIPFKVFPPFFYPKIFFYEWNITRAKAKPYRLDKKNYY